jgi:hypothetical protein
MKECEKINMIQEIKSVIHKEEEEEERENSNQRRDNKSKQINFSQKWIQYSQKNLLPKEFINLENEIKQHENNNAHKKPRLNSINMELKRKNENLRYQFKKRHEQIQILQIKNIELEKDLVQLKIDHKKQLTFIAIGVTILLIIENVFILGIAKFIMSL